jgi:hypothetical protein
MQDIYGGKVLGVPLPDGNYHCFNAVGDCVFDLTSEQFQDVTLNYTDCPEQHRGTHFAKEEKRQRYELLKQRLLTGDEQIDLVAKHLLEEYRPAFLKLANDDQ